MSRLIAYYCCSTAKHSSESQRHALLKLAKVDFFDEEFSDKGISSLLPSSERPSFVNLLLYMCKGDTLYVYALDRLGCNAVDVQANIHALLDKGVVIQVYGLGKIARNTGKLVLAVLDQMVDMELRHIAAVHQAEKSEKPLLADPAIVKAWRAKNWASIAKTAEHFGLPIATVKRYCKR